MIDIMDRPYEVRLTEIYDLVYSARGKDYPAEAAALTELIRSRRPDAASLLDVGCGTGEHLRLLSQEFPDVAGLELSEPMRAKAVAKLPGVPVHAGDMRGFHLNRTFDVVVCLFSVIGYVRNVGELHAVAEAMAAHLDPGGLLVLDPWFGPDDFTGGYLDHTVAIADGRKVLRLAQSSKQDRTSQVVYHYLVGDAEGITYFTDLHEMSLFTRDEYTAALHAAGCADVEFTAGWAQGRDLILATRT